MVLEFKDLEGKKHDCVSELEINGETYYITFGKKVYTQNEKGEFTQCTEVPEELKLYLQEPKSLDLIENN